MAPEENGRIPESPARSVWRLAAPSLAVSLTLLSVAVLAAVSLMQMQHEAHVSLQEIAEAVEASADLDQLAADWRKGLGEYVATGDASYIRNLPGVQQSPDSYVLRFNTLKLERDGDRLFVRFRPVYIVVLEDPWALRSLKERQAAADHLLNVLDEETRKQHELTQQALAGARARNQELSGWTRWTLLLLGVVGAGAGTLAGFSLARGMRRQLVQLSVPVQTAAGTLDEIVGPVEVSASGNIDQLQDSLHDLADRVASVVERLQAAERQSLLNEQMAALGQLAAGLAHELRNPLTSLKTLVESARSNGAASGLDERDLAVMEEEISRLDGTLQSFLDYARPPALHKTELDLRNVIQKTVQLVTARAEQQSIDIETRLPDGPIPLDADAGQLRQVLLNLLLNAFDSTGPGGSVVLEVEPAADEVVIRVRDDGPGIPESVRDRLFEPFVSSKPSGTGLGLTICRRIVENHGGRVAADNRPEGGAEFSIRLPAGCGVAVDEPVALMTGDSGLDIDSNEGPG